MAEIIVSLRHRHLHIIDDIVDASESYPDMPIWHVRCDCGLRQTWADRLEAQTAMLIHRLEFLNNQQHAITIRNDA